MKPLQTTCGLRMTEKAKVSGGRKINRNKCLPTGIMKEQNHTWVDASDGGEVVLYPSRFLLLL